MGGTAPGAAPRRSIAPAHEPHRRRIHRLRRRQDAVRASASACWAAPPCTSRWPRRSSTRCASSARSATTSARASSRCCAARGSITDDIEHVAGRQDVLLAGRVRRRRQLARDAAAPTSTSSSDFQPKLSDASREADIAVPGQHPAGAAARGPRAVRARALRRAGLDEPVDRHRPRRRSCGRSRSVDCLILNDAELASSRASRTSSRAAREILDLGPAASCRRQAGRVRRGAVHARGLLRAARLPAGDGRRPDRRRRHVRRRLRRLRRRPPRRGAHRRAAAPRDGLRDRARVLQRRGVRHRARERLTAEEITERVERLQRMTSFELAPVALRG